MLHNTLHNSIHISLLQFPHFSHGCRPGNILTYNPIRALELIGYQRIITSADYSLPLKVWLQYDRQFHTLAASNPSLHWDQCHSQLWYEAMAAANNTNQVKKRWPCPYCGAGGHCAENCPCLPFHDSSQHPKPPNLRVSGALMCHDLIDIAQKRMYFPTQLPVMQGPTPLNLMTGQNRQKNSQPEPAILDACRDDRSLLSVTKCIIDLCFHPIAANLCTTTFQYSNDLINNIQNTIKVICR